MTRISKKEIIKLAKQKNILTKDFKKELERYYAQFQLHIISQEQLFKLLNLQSIIL